MSSLVNFQIFTFAFYSKFWFVSSCTACLTTGIVLSVDLIYMGSQDVDLCMLAKAIQRGYNVQRLVTDISIAIVWLTGL